MHCTGMRGVGQHNKVQVDLVQTPWNINEEYADANVDSSIVFYRRHAGCGTSMIFTALLGILCFCALG